MIGGGVKLNTRNAELFHYGVKGMKWGVRRKRNEHNKNIRKRIVGMLMNMYQCGITNFCRKLRSATVIGPNF